MHAVATFDALCILVGTLEVPTGTDLAGTETARGHLVDLLANG